MQRKLSVCRGGGRFSGKRRQTTVGLWTFFGYSGGLERTSLTALCRPRPTNPIQSNLFK